jgi:hypothetical protein
MNSDNNTPVEPVDIDTTEEQSLDEFEAEFFSPGKAPDKKPVAEETNEDNVSDSDNNEETSVEDSVDDTESSDNEETPSNNKKESRAEKRIRELNAKFREEQRKRLELEQLLEERKRLEESKISDNNGPTPAVNSKKEEEDRPPHWDDEDENGNKKYPLGQFDPKFNSDLVAYTVRKETEAFQERMRQAEFQRRQEEAERALQEQWQQKLTVAQERYPDFMEKGQELIDNFSDLDPAYGKYLTDTIRSIDNGTDVLYYLASHPDIARDIVNQGAAKATLALGRISAMLDNDEAPTTKNAARTKTTNAPPPPPKAKGSALPKIRDLDNLDDFEEVFFRRK